MKPTGEMKPAAPTNNPGEAPVPAIAQAANDAMIRSPLDATPSPEGKRVYYTAFKRSEDGEDIPGVFTVAADGSGAIETLVQGDPLGAPVGISVSLDGSKLFVADPASGPEAAGAVLTLAANGGSASPLPGTERYRPKGVAVAKVKDEEYLYFTGHAPDSGQAGVFRIGAGGGTATALASGEPFGDPSGLVVSAKGDVYVVEASVDQHAARVLRVSGAKVEAFVENIGIGFPAGITLTHDDSTLLVSGLDPDTKHDVVYFVNVATGAVSRLTKTVGQFAEPAGLHRAHNTDVFAWADSEANASGTVYVLKP